MAYRMRRASSEIEAAATLRIFEHYLINTDVDETYAELKRIVLDTNRWLAPYDGAGGGGGGATPGA
jgi:guanylate kinase